MSERTDDDRANTARTPTANVRKLFAEDDLWIVREVAQPYDRRGTHLIFESSSAMRRLRTFPANWFELDDEALYALSCTIRQR